MEYPDIASKVTAVLGAYDLRSSTLAAVLGVDKTTAWRWASNPDRLPPEKLQKLIEGLCAAAAKKGGTVVTDNFKIHNLADFTAALGGASPRAVDRSGVAPPLPQTLIDAARAPQELLSPFCSCYRMIWALPDGDFAQAEAIASSLPDGRVRFTMVRSGRDHLEINGFLIRQEAEIYALGDRISPRFSKRFMCIPLEAEYEGKNLKHLRGFMPEYGMQLVSTPVMLVPCDRSVAQKITDGKIATIDLALTKELVGIEGVQFLRPN